MRRGQANVILLVLIALGIVILATFNFTGFSTFSTQPLDEETQIYPPEQPEEQEQTPVETELPQALTMELPPVVQEFQISDSGDATGTTGIPATVLFAPLYFSKTPSPNTYNTRITLTNVGESNETVHIFFIGGTGSSCSTADYKTCLVQNQTTTFVVADYDPDTIGSILFVTENSTGVANGHNSLIGSVEYKNGTESASYNMMGFRSVSGSAGINSTGEGTLIFDDVYLEKWPNGVIASDLPSALDNNSNKLFLVTPILNLTSGGNATTNVSGILYDNSSNSYTYNFTKAGCLQIYNLNDTFPPTTPGFNTTVPSGTIGWTKIWSTSDKPLVGMYTNYNPNATSTAFNGGQILNGYCNGSCPSYNISYPKFAQSC